MICSSASGTAAAISRAAGMLATSRLPHRTSVGAWMLASRPRKFASATTRSAPSHCALVMAMSVAELSGSMRMIVR
jgi:hypothetical protein